MIESKPSAQTVESQARRNVRVLGFASAWNDVASEMIYPLLPGFLLSLPGANRTWLGAIEGVAEAVSSLVKYFSGRWSDHTSRRKEWVVFGYMASGLARPFTALAGSASHVLAVRLVDRTSKGLRAAPRDALVADSVPHAERGRAFGFQRAMDHTGAMIGPLIAMAWMGWWPEGLRWLFAAAIVPGLVAAALVALWLVEPHRTARQRDPNAPAAKESTQIESTPSQNTRSHGFGWLLGALCMFALGNSSDAFLLVRSGDLGVAESLRPALWFVFHAVKSTGSMAAGRLIDRFGAARWLGIGWVFYALVYTLWGEATQSWHAWLLFPIYGLYHALAEPAERVLIAAHGRAKRRGTAFGWFHSAIGLASIPASMGFGWLYDHAGAPIAFRCGAGLALIACGLLWIAQRADRT